MGRPGGGTTRRRFLQGLGALGGAAAVYHGAGALGLLKMKSAQAAMADYPAGTGTGHSVVVIGAGVAGICAAWHLARAGFAVTVLEANARPGGRNFTIRDGDSFAEVGGPVQTARFVQNSYPDGTPVPVPTYANCGAGRIGAHSALVLDYCRRFGTRLEPYQFYSASALLQSDRAFGGRPMPMRQIRHNLRGEIAEMLATNVQQKGLDAPLTKEDRDRFLAMLQQFGDLRSLPDGRYLFDQTERAGFLIDPIAGLEAGEPMPAVSLREILQSDFWNHKLFQQLSYRWQATLVQPVGGMDMLWRNMLRQEMPDGRILADRMRLQSPVAEIRNRDDGVTVVTEAGEQLDAAFCISTIAPPQLAERVQGLEPPVVAALADVPYEPCVTMAAQFDNRFWESDSRTTGRILGGISWTDGVTDQLWYPSSEFFTTHGVMRICYNFDRTAAAFGALSPSERLDAAIAQGEKFHPGLFARHIMRESAVSVAWHRMPYFIGIGVYEDYYADGEVDPNRGNLDRYRFLKTRFPAGRLHLAGDYFSLVPGWMDGALESAEQAVSQIVHQVRSR
ncbi:flavin monoamine oxidase family protein [Marinibaculum pumilum]|uniref:Tryptophan 2-monooxygenase n=1 Tax=Marinibaculum pumilum TaxID=1766165 RepID=A0ABV7KYY9_9PROT